METPFVLCGILLTTVWAACIARTIFTSPKYHFDDEDEMEPEVDDVPEVEHKVGNNEDAKVEHEVQNEIVKVEHEVQNEIAKVEHEVQNEIVNVEHEVHNEDVKVGHEVHIEEVHDTENKVEHTGNEVENGDVVQTEEVENDADYLLGEEFVGDQVLG